MWIDPFWIGFLTGLPAGLTVTIILIAVLVRSRKGKKRA